jgi:hypothetical protein
MLDLRRFLIVGLSIRNWPLFAVFASSFWAARRRLVWEIASVVTVRIIKNGDASLPQVYVSCQLINVCQI